MFKQQIGVVGMAVMGCNLALNLANHNYTVSIYNRSHEKTKYIALNNQEKSLYPFYTIKDFVCSLDKPRCILLMVQSGIATDHTISSIIPFLSKEDILIDGGNTFYKDTMRRNRELSRTGFNFIGAGISGGSQGALIGPSIMPGGQKEAYDLIKPMFFKIAAKSQGEPCVSYIGPDGSGHYVKMVHNGIEYSDMQLIAEVYSILKYLVGISNSDLSEVFHEWNKGELNSYLIEITQDIFLKKDEQGNYLIDFILDTAANKGTGKWTSKSALDLEEPLTLITESVFFRYLSALKVQRMLASQLLTGPKIKSLVKHKSRVIEKVRKALYLGKIISYAQGFSQLNSASKKYHWNLECKNIAKIFRAGCIIRAGFLKNIIEAYSENNRLINLLFSPYFQQIANEYQFALRDIVSLAITNGIPVPALSAAITYFDSYRSRFLSSNLIQAQRDYFGSHTYQRTDRNGNFHTDWSY
ncbi:NADP-dependent phosphogluconate dehydrogenase [Buchnera aphidicola (Hormaphis cornu)]|nr:NADP-dependent phosphogluconate dehydrogenase [Buchnera aphidicola (Hormaphis cornu)]